MGNSDDDWGRVKNDPFDILLLLEKAPLGGKEFTERYLFVFLPRSMCSELGPGFLISETLKLCFIYQGLVSFADLSGKLIYICSDYERALTTYIFGLPCLFL